MSVGDLVFVVCVCLTYLGLTPNLTPLALNPLWSPVPQAQKLIAAATPPVAEWRPQPDGNWAAGGASALLIMAEENEEPSSGMYLYIYTYRYL